MTAQEKLRLKIGGALRSTTITQTGNRKVGIVAENSTSMCSV